MDWMHPLIGLDWIVLNSISKNGPMFNAGRNIYCSLSIAYWAKRWIYY